MNELFPSNPSPLLVSAFCVLLVASVYTLWKIRQSSGSQWLRWNQVSPLPLTQIEIIATLLMVLFSMRYLPVVLPVVGFAAGLILTQRHGRVLAQQWGLDPRKYPACFRSAFATYLAGLAPLIAATALSFMVCQLFGRDNLIQETVMDFKNGSRAQMIQIFLLATIFAPLWEEMVFRGIVYPWLKSKTTQKAALIISALFFASIHNHLPSFFPLALFGLALALVYEYTGSLVASIVLHALFNFATCLNLLLMRPS